MKWTLVIGLIVLAAVLMVLLPGCSQTLTAVQQSEQALTTTINSYDAALSILTTYRTAKKISDADALKIEPWREAVVASLAEWNATYTSSTAGTLQAITIATKGVEVFVACEIAVESGTPLPLPAPPASAPKPKKMLTPGEIDLLLTVLGDIVQFGITEIENWTPGTQSQLDNALAQALASEQAANNAWAATLPATAAKPLAKK